jgi:hypothetical protein
MVIVNKILWVVPAIPPYIVVNPRDYEGIASRRGESRDVTFG